MDSWTLVFSSIAAREEAMQTLAAYSNLVACKCGAYRKALDRCRICGRVPPKSERIPAQFEEEAGEPR